MRNRLAFLWRTITGLFGELSDQNAYQRHLQSQGVQHSPAEWRSFIDERLRAKYARAKCC